MSNRPRMNYRNIDVIQNNRIAANLSNAGDLAHRRKGSGSKWYAKGDTISKMFLVEAKDKAAPAKQRTIHKSTFDKLKLEAIEENKIPLYVVGFGDGRDFIIMDDLDFYGLVDRLVAAEAELEELKSKRED
ncbi:hypothetical protein MOD67_14250 [Bacillus licheniformis]|uniref:hypothetical protein n=1 Tax=Bacillus TaxID=1386 RepID=UPI0020C8B8CB|nr:MULTISPECIES: hypothetical protein [Bacillus]MCP8973211.1 hypothetical protein [Bacillus licheniformis]MCY7861185.1 hypothetical protein [Bacillus haynesii]MCY8015487.1 hypothetical protein [Bacillus haynesii]MCY8291486.1 hypothetical protein [Bacillus haynesii]MCY8549109.1 hypothetical protein [Bacillus haynesii]